MAGGTRLGVVTRVTAAGVYVELADVAAGFEFGPCLDTVGGLAVGDKVVAQSLARDEDELVITGRVGGAGGGTGIIPISRLPVAPSGNANATQIVRADDARLSLDAHYPIGAVYLSVVNSAPGPLLGGTWVALPPGLALTTVDPAQTEFNTPEKTGGAKTVTLTAAQSGSPAHSHGVNDPGHTHGQNLGGPITTAAPAAGGAVVGTANTSTTASSTTGLTVSASTPANAAAAHDNLAPYLTLYGWKRTA